MSQKSGYNGIVHPISRRKCSAHIALFSLIPSKAVICSIGLNGLEEDGRGWNRLELAEIGWYMLE